MNDPGADVSTERERLIFGAGFAFGVMFTLLILAVVLSAVVSRSATLTSLFSSTVLLPVIAAVSFALIVGVALYVLALPEQGIDIPHRTVFEAHDTETDADIDTE